MTTCMLAWHSTIRTSMTSSMIAWLRTMRTPATTSTERRAHFSGSVVVSSSSHTHAPWLKFAPFIPSPYSCSRVRSLHLDPPFLLLALPSAPFPLPQLHEVYGKPAQLLQWGCGRLWRPPPLHRLWAQGPWLLRDHSRGEPHIRRRSSRTKSLLRTQTTMTLHSKTCSIKYIERKSITLYEKTCLSVVVVNVR